MNSDTQTLYMCRHACSELRDYDVHFRTGNNPNPLHFYTILEDPLGCLTFYHTFYSESWPFAQVNYDHGVFKFTTLQLEGEYLGNVKNQLSLVG
jgi:hypothetical protein